MHIAKEGHTKNVESSSNAPSSNAYTEAVSVPFIPRVMVFCATYNNKFSPVLRVVGSLQAVRHARREVP